MIIIGDNFFDGLQVVFGTMLVWSEVSLRHWTLCWSSFTGGGVAVTSTQTQGALVQEPPWTGVLRGVGAERPHPNPPPRGFKPAVGGPCEHGNN